MQNEVNDLLTAAVEAARDYVRGLAKTLTEENLPGRVRGRARGPELHNNKSTCQDRQLNAQFDACLLWQGLRANKLWKTH